MLSSDQTPAADLRVLQVGDTATCDFQVTADDVQAFARLSHDTNALHLDPEFAQNLGFPAPVAHGMLSLGAISRLIGTRLPGPGALWMSQEVRFTAPVLVGDTLTALVRVERLSLAAGVVQLATTVTNHRTNRPVLEGSAKVKVLTPQVR